MTTFKRILPPIEYVCRHVRPRRCCMACRSNFLTPHRKYVARDVGVALFSAAIDRYKRPRKVVR